MSLAPFWMRALRWYSLHAPVQRGTYRLAAWLYQPRRIPDVEVPASLDRTLSVRLRLPIWVDYNMYCLGLYEAYLARFFMGATRADSIVLDIGAYIGQYTLLAAKRAWRGRVVAVEPHPESHRRLHAHVTGNGLTNVTLVEKAAGRLPGESRLALREQAFTSALCTTSGQAGSGRWPVTTVEVVRVDDLVDELALPRVDMVKVDVEGAESQVLRGARDTLACYRPLVIFELNPEREKAFGDAPEGLVAYLGDLGYTLHALKGGRPVPVGKALPSYGNLIAIHRATTDPCAAPRGGACGT